jgi:hypothetical protein
MPFIAVGRTLIDAELAFTGFASAIRVVLDNYCEFGERRNVDIALSSKLTTTGYLLTTHSGFDEEITPSCSGYSKPLFRKEMAVSCARNGQ